MQLLQTRTQRLVEARKLYEFQLPSTLPLVVKLVSCCSAIHVCHVEFTVKSLSFPNVSELDIVCLLPAEKEIVELTLVVQVPLMLAPLQAFISTALAHAAKRAVTIESFMLR